MNCKVKENALLPRLHCIIDAKDTNNDKSLHIENSSEKVISNELQIDMQSVNKFENELDVAGLFIDTKKGQCKGKNKILGKEFSSDGNIISNTSEKHLL